MCARIGGFAMALLLSACGGSEPLTVSTPPPSAPPAAMTVRVGVGVVDMTPEVGYCAGQYCDYATDTLGGLINGDFDPFLTHTLKHASYGIQSRLSARAAVIDGTSAPAPAKRRPKSAKDSQESLF